MVMRDIYLLSKSEEFHLGSGQESSINLALKKAPAFPCTRLCGRVVSSCTAIPGATVKMLDKDSMPVCHTKTDDEGHFSFVNTLVPGDYEIIASADNYMVSESSFISLFPFVSVYKTIKLTPDKNAENVVVYGTVRNNENTPLPDAQVCVFSCNNMELPTSVAMTNADGEYLFTGLKPGKYAMSALCYGYVLPEEMKIEILPKEIFCADLYLYRSDSGVKGTVSGAVYHNGHTVPYAVTALKRKESNGFRLIQIRQANSKGVYLFTDLEAGEYIVTAKLK